jgi:hypothetical protein
VRCGDARSVGRVMKPVGSSARSTRGALDRDRKKRRWARRSG